MSKESDYSIGKKIQISRRSRGLTQEQLAVLAKVPYATLIKIESGAIKNPSLEAVTKLAQALQISLDTFTQIDRYQGRGAILKIFDDVRASVKAGDTMYLSGIDEKMYVAIVKKEVNRFISDLRDLKVRQCIISREGDRFKLKGDHLEYRWIPKQFFSPFPIYSYADRLATLSWGPPLECVILRNADLADAYRKQFLFMWEYAKSFSKPSRSR